MSLGAPLQVGKPCPAAYQACLTLAQTRPPPLAEVTLAGHHWTPEAHEWDGGGMGPGGESGHTAVPHRYLHALAATWGCRTVTRPSLGEQSEDSQGQKDVPESGDVKVGEQTLRLGGVRPGGACPS